MHEQTINYRFFNIIEPDLNRLLSIDIELFIQWPSEMFIINSFPIKNNCVQNLDNNHYSCLVKLCSFEAFFFDTVGLKESFESFEIRFFFLQCIMISENEISVQLWSNTDNFILILEIFMRRHTLFFYHVYGDVLWMIEYWDREHSKTNSKCFNHTSVTWQTKIYSCRELFSHSTWIENTKWMEIKYNWTETDFSFSHTHTANYHNFKTNGKAFK